MTRDLAAPISAARSYRATTQTKKIPRSDASYYRITPTWDLCITYRKGAYLTDAAKDFIAMVRAYWAEHLAPVQTN